MTAFFVAGIPIPQGSKKGFSPKGSTLVQIVDDNKAALHPWREQIARRAFSTWAYQKPIDGPCRVEAAFVLPRKPSVKRELPTVAPDLDKLLRALLDGITQAGNVWADDSRVVEIHSTKVYGAEPGVHVTITEISAVATVAAPVEKAAAAVEGGTAA
ncbi:RusA family crossover junction endodeoxyribonuclease [Microbacterium kunmingense]|uniref:RusA family crossover junction endodeoxyribonuclease n=1 Tax=Microbacterium kunmingense TaxID=2915939 RepID=UPI002004DFED|nr:RusA family crossover junction endodeoxyribonuclease [Microbacterium kunmingense]